MGSQSCDSTMLLNRRPFSSEYHHHESRGRFDSNSMSRYRDVWNKREGFSSITGLKDDPVTLRSIIGLQLIMLWVLVEEIILLIHY